MFALLIISLVLTYIAIGALSRMPIAWMFEGLDHSYYHGHWSTIGQKHRNTEPATKTLQAAFWPFFMLIVFLWALVYVFEMSRRTLVDIAEWIGGYLI